MSTYILQKDLPNLNVGAEFIWDNEKRLYVYAVDPSYQSFTALIVESSQWFAPKKEEKIEIEVLGNITLNIVNSAEKGLFIKSSHTIPPEKYEAVKKAIEFVLNDSPAFNHERISKQLDRIHYLQALGCDLISRIYHYGNFKAETRNERLLESVLNELQLYPTTENDILQRPPIPENLNNNQ